MEGFFDKGGDLADLGGSDDEIDEGISLFDFFGSDLGHASGDSDDDFGSVGFDDAEFAEEGESFVFGLFADAARVEENDLG